MTQLPSIEISLNQVAVTALLDGEGRVLEINEKFQRLLGISHDKLESLKFCNLLNLDAAENSADQLSFHLKNRLIWQGELCFLAVHNGSEWVQGSLMPIETVEGPALFHFIGFNITDRKNVENALSRTHSFMTRILELLPVGFFMADASGECTYVNDQWIRASGIRLRKALQHNWLSAVCERDRQRVKNTWFEFLKGTSDFHAEFSYQQADGRLMTVDAAASKIEGPEETVIIRIEKDITNLRERDRTIHDQQIALFHANHNFALLDMASSVAHEINNPIAVIQSKANKILRGLRSETPSIDDLSVAAATIDSMSERITRIVKSLIFVTERPEAARLGKATPKTCFDALLNLSSERIQSANVVLNRDTSNDDLEFDCRQSEITEMLWQLLTNAFDAVAHSHAGERIITLRTMIEDNFICFLVTDSGPKIPVEVESRLFEPLFSTKRPGKGMGLGLCIARSIAEAHKGSLSYLRDAHGTTFIAKISTSF